jgi:tetratricopeptide (TPR) repeat protein
MSLRFILNFVFTAILLAAQDPAVKAQRAKELMGAGKFQEAAAIYEELVREIPGNPGLLMNLGMALHMAGEDRKAIPHLAAAVKQQPQMVPAQLFLGASYLRIGEPVKAISHLESVVRAQPAYGEARHLLADALFAAKRLEEAALQYRTLAESDSRKPQIWHALGRVYEALSQSAFETLTKTAPDSAEHLAMLAEARFHQQQYSASYYLYRQALERNPKMASARQAISEIYRNTGHADWAAKEEALAPPVACPGPGVECDYLAGQFLKVAQTAKLKKTPEGYYWLTRAYNELARHAFSQLRALPDSPQLHEHLAEVHRGQRRHREAVDEWRKALALAPGNPRLEAELAQSLFEARDYEAAREITERLLQADPASPEMNHLHGEILLGMQNFEQAVPHLTKVVKSAPKLLTAHGSLGRALALSGAAEQAIPHLKAALPIDDDGSLHYQLARAYQSTGQPELAKQALAKYQELSKQAQADSEAAQKEIQITAP